jgi:hypothetical protein
MTSTTTKNGRLGNQSITTINLQFYNIIKRVIILIAKKYKP